jgi:four helix bundle protein
MVKSYADLIVWQRAMDLTEEVYLLASKLPADERFGLGQQLKRSAVSVPSNIAEGHERRSRKEYGRFLSISCGSVAELETQIRLCVRLGFLDQESVERAEGLAGETGRMLRAIERTLRAQTRIEEPGHDYLESWTVTDDYVAGRSALNPDPARGADLRGSHSEAALAPTDPSALSPQP